MLFADSPSKRFMLYGVCFLVGVAVGSLALEERRGFFSAIGGPASGWVFILLLCILIPPLVVFWKSRTMRTVLYCAIAVVLGAGRVNAALPDFTPNLNGIRSFDSAFGLAQDDRLVHIATQAGEFLSFAGWVAVEPDEREDHTRLTVESEAPYRGRVLVKTDRYPVMSYGTPVEVTCELERPDSLSSRAPRSGDPGSRRRPRESGEPSTSLDSGSPGASGMTNSTFRYDRYLRRDDIYVLCRNAVVRARLAEQRGSRAIAALLGVKHKMQKIIGENLPEPHASFLGGLLYGARSTIPAELQESFRRTGTSHIIAISGYNITVVTSMVMLALMAVLIPRKKAFWLAIAAIASFVIMVGAQASVVRAGAMGMLGLTAQQVGRLARPLPLIVAAAVGMVLVNPFVLLFDAGFELSFLAVIGLTYLAPDLERFFQWLPKRLGQVIAETTGAIVLTLPLMMYQFERVSVVAPIANTAILLAIPWIMLSGFAAVIGALVVPFLGQVLFGLTYVLLSYVIKVVELFARLPFASVEARLPLWVMIGVYGILLWFLLKKRLPLLSPASL
ncbi:MAG: ComEC/Rec2 family competence protein [Candidatus Magasanikbacteria bacterium]|nr:ComEC/Rec2 family competence protein [Candidatus Magasanikbacteria bacterium]